ncbi:hypothetical protein ACQP1P_33470 [Dactylosporangium sp. CA-052675]|uniref:hypothetical protein n=1 Tax=Dactylosporangium sp. CA-052675 TaxID=3239927 RepID=UPI003D89F76B
MTANLIAWADVEGRGFAPIRASDTASSAAPEFWAVAERLIDDAVVQPAVRSTLDHPVYSLRAVTVPRHGRYWCFAEQGRGGHFGVAGTCRFKFEPFAAGAQQAWAEGIAAVGGKEPLAAGHADEAGVRHALNGLLFGQPLLRLPGTPAEAAITIYAVLGVLPKAVAAEYTWSTCPLQEPRPNLVTANLPADFRTGSPLDRVIDRIRWSVPPGAEAVARRLGTQAHRSAFELLVSRAVRLHHDPDLLDAPAETVEELVEHTATNIAFPTPETVPDLLREREGRRRLADFPHEVTKWAEGSPEAARRALVKLEEPGLRQAILLPLFDALLDRPGDAGTASLVHEAEPDPEHLADTIRERKRAGLWTAPDSWLDTLGVSPWKHHDLFIDPSPHLVAELAGPGFTPRARQVLLARGPRFAQHVLTQMPKVGPAAAAGLVAAAAERPAEGAALDPGDLYRLGSVLIARADSKPAERWLLDFDAALGVHQPPRPAVRQVLYGAVNDMLKRGGLRDPHLAELIHRSAMHSAHHNEPMPVMVKRLLDQPRTTVPAHREPDPQTGTGHPETGPRRGGRVALDRREKVRWGIAAGTAAALAGVVIWAGVRSGEQPGGESASGAPVVTGTSPSNRFRPGEPAAADTIKVSWDGTQKATDKVLGELHTLLEKLPQRRVVYVMLGPAGPDPQTAAQSALALQATLQQAQLPELADARYVVAAPTPAADQKSSIELTLITEAQ